MSRQGMPETTAGGLELALGKQMQHAIDVYIKIYIYEHIPLQIAEGLSLADGGLCGVCF